MTERKRWWIQPPAGRIIAFDTWDDWVDDLFQRGITNPGEGGTSTDPDSGLVTVWGTANRAAHNADSVKLFKPYGQRSVPDLALALHVRDEELRVISDHAADVRALVKRLVIEDPMFREAYEGFNDCCMYCGHTPTTYSLTTGPQIHEDDCAWIAGMDLLGRPRTQDLHGTTYPTHVTKSEAGS